MFAAAAPGSLVLSPSNRLAAEALGDSGSVLDVGCGGGSAAFAVAPPATTVIGVDRQPDMVEMFMRTAGRRGISASVHAGSWPEIGAEVPCADVVVCHHVLYNIGDLVPFVAALNEHARRRVVIEITPSHPRAYRRHLWSHFWGVEPPLGPMAADAGAVIGELGISAAVECFELPGKHTMPEHAEIVVSHLCRQLCLPPEREAEVAELIAEQPFDSRRVVIWWDKPNRTQSEMKHPPPQGHH